MKKDSLDEIASIFGISSKAVYDIILRYSNKESLMLMNNVSSVFPGVVDQIVETKEMLNKEYVYEPGDESCIIPFDKKCRVYYLYDCGTLVYIGMTTHLSARISTHIGEKEFDKVSYVDVDRIKMSLIESLNIYAYTPRDNIKVWTAEDYFSAVLGNCVFEYDID